MTATTKETKMPEPEMPEPTLTVSDTRGGTAVVGPLDTHRVPDCPEEERIEVVCLATDFSQRLNARLGLRKAEEGDRIPDKFAERVPGDRFLLDAEDLPRLLSCNAVVLPSELEVNKELDQRLDELEAERQEVERARAEAAEGARQEVEREREEAAEGARQEVERARAEAAEGA
ncbi:MAG: hypothetical protein AABM42_07335 [Actinomycetota bacterium]